MASPAHPHKPAVEDDLLDQIPMNRTKPTTILFVVGALLVVIGAVAFSVMRGRANKKADADAAAAAATPTATSTMTPEEQKRHLEITQRSLEAFEKAEAEKKQTEPKPLEQGKPTEEAKSAATAHTTTGAATPAVAAAPAAEPAAATPPAPKKNKKAMSDLDGLGSDIAGQLGK